MFKSFSRFTKSDSGIWFIVIIVVLLIIWALLSYSNSKTSVLDNYQNVTNFADTVAPGPDQYKNNVATTASSLNSANKMPPAGVANGYALAPVANPADLLPKPSNMTGALNPVSNVAAGTPFPTDLIQAASLQGLDTIGSSLRNPNLDLRSDPIIPKVNIGPWYQSTIEPDLARVPLELGAGCTP
jgi:hypothetical protein